MPDKRIDITGSNDPRAALVCARLYLRRGKRRLEQGYSAACMAALYDAVLFGMRYYVARHKSCASFMENTDLWDPASLFCALARAGVLDNPFGFNRFSLMVERALWQESFSFDANATLAEVETILMKLDIMPLDGSALPGESLAAH